MRKIPKDLDFFELLEWVAIAVAIFGNPVKLVRKVMKREG